jgi:hypothetical protein
LLISEVILDACEAPLSIFFNRNGAFRYTLEEEEEGPDEEVLGGCSDCCCRCGFDWLVFLEGDVESGGAAKATVSSAAVLYFEVGTSTPLIAVVVANTCALLVLLLLPDRPAFLRAAAELGSNFLAYGKTANGISKGYDKFSALRQSSVFRKGQMNKILTTGLMDKVAMSADI